MKVSFYLNKERKKNLYCRLSEGTKRTTFSLKQEIKPEHWNEQKAFLNDDSQYSYTLFSLKRYILERDQALKLDDVQKKLDVLREEIENLLGGIGLERLNKVFWNANAERFGFEHYELFIKAIEKHSGFKREQLKVATLGYCLNYSTPDNKTYEILSYSSFKHFLMSILERKSYDEIYTETWPEIWREVFDDSFDKEKFVLEFYKQWDVFWNKKREELGHTDHIEKLRLESMTHFNVVINSCTQENIFDIVTEVDDMELYSIYIITMLQIYNTEACFEEYAEIFLIASEIWDWTPVFLTDDDKEEGFYVREVEDHDIVKVV